MKLKKRKISSDVGGVNKLEPQSKISKKTTELVENVDLEVTNNETPHDFDIKHFRKQITNPANKLSGLIQFLHVCNKSSIDYIAEYLKSGGTPGEILKQLDDQKNVNLAATVFDLFHLVLLKIQSSSAHLLQSAEDTCRYFLNSYVPIMETMLSEKSSPKQQKSMLKLLTAIVTLNSELGLTVLNQLALKPKTLGHLIKHSSGKDNNDVRLSFINFLMAFLVDNNTPLIKALLDKQGLLGMIFQELVRDEASTILMVLPLLKKSMIYNINISKTMKIRTFSHHVITCIFNIFNWKGSNKKSDKDDTNLKCDIETVVEDFLFILFTSHKHGIYFTDKSLGTGDVPTNQYLCKAIESLEAPWNNEKAGSLLIKMIIACPDLYKPVKQVIEDSFNPRNSEQWYKCVNFLKNIITQISAVKVINTVAEINPRQIVTFIKNTYLSLNMLKTSTEILKSKDSEMKNEIILLLYTILENINNYIKILDSNEVYGNNIKGALQNILQTSIHKYFPSTDCLILNMHTILDTVKEEDKLQSVDSSVSVSEYLINILNLLLLYNDIMPNLIDPVSAMLDTRRIFQKMEYIKDNIIDLKLKTTMFLLCADKYAFAPDKPLFKEILSGMFEVYISQNSNMVCEVKQVLHNILDTTGIFERNTAEIDLVLYAVNAVSSKHTETTAPMIIEVIENIIVNKKSYTDILCKFSFDSTDSGGHENKENFDDIFNNIQNFKKNKGDVHYIQESKSLTPFLIGLLELMEEVGKRHDAIFDFTNHLIICLLHFHDSPENICTILEKYENMNGDIKNYVYSWKSLPSQLNKNIVNKNSILFKLSKGLLKDKEIIIKDVFNIKEIEIDTTEKHPAINKIDYNIVDNFNGMSEVNILLNMVTFYTFHQSTLNVLNENRLSNAVQVISCIMEMCLRDNKFTTKNYVTAVSKCLGCDLLQQKFNPLKQNNVDALLTDFVFKMVSICNEKSIEMKLIKPIIKPYQHKIFLSLMSEAKNSIENLKGFKYDDLDNVFSIINLNLNDAMVLLDEILQLNITCMATVANEPSSWIEVISHILHQCIDNNFQLPSIVFNKICILYCKIIKEFDFVMNVSSLEENMYNYFISNLNLISNVHLNIFEDIFSTKYFSKYTSKLAVLFLQLNPHLVTKFTKNIIKDDVINKREFVLPLTKAAFIHDKFENSKDTQMAVYQHYKANIIKVIEKPQKATQIYIENVDTVIKLIYHCMDITECETFLKKNNKFDVLENFHVDILEAIFFKSSIVDGKLIPNYLENFIMSILQLSNVVLKRDDSQYDKTLKISSLLNKIIVLLNNNENRDILDAFDFKNIIECSAWQNFYKNCLIAYLKPVDGNSHNCSFHLFESLGHIVNIMYPTDHPGILDLFEMVTSHSEFLNMMLSNQYQDVKTHMISLIYILINKNKSVMKVLHLPFYLSAYQGTVSKKDKTLVAILRYYESNGLSMNEYKPYLWGDIGANHYALKSSRKKASLWSNPSVNHVLNLFDRERIEKTIKYFPIKAELNSEHGILLESNEIDLINIIDNIITNTPSSFLLLKKKSVINRCEYVNMKLKLDQYKSILNKIDVECLNLRRDLNNEDIYDPGFLLPLLNFIVAPGSSVSCHRILRSGILAIPLMALASYCPQMRAAAYNVLFRFYSLLESEMYYKNDKLLWSQFLNSLRASLDTAISSADGETEEDGPKLSPRLPALSALYLARAAIVMTSPLDPMFKPINNFVISKQHINFSIVPDFLDLFHSSDVNYIERRLWILKLLRDGMKTFSDVKLLLKSVAFKILFDFYSCSISDVKEKLIIMEILNNAVCIPKAARILADAYGLFPWLSSTICSLNSDNTNLISASIKLVYHIFVNLVIEKTAKVIAAPKNMLDLLINGKAFKIGDTQQCHILCLLIDFMNKLSGVSLDDMKIYLNTLRKISNDNIKLINQSQLLKLVEDCGNMFDLKNRFCKNIILGIKNKKCSLVLSSKVIIDQSIELGDDNIVIQYLHEVVINWLS